MSRLFLTLVFAAATVTAHADESDKPAEIGREAPALQCQSWVRGDAVDLVKVAGERYHVIVFWAPENRGSVLSLPKLSEVHTKHNDKVSVVGIAADTDLERIRKFVKAREDRIPYPVAVDDEGKTKQAYCEPYQVDRIPIAFIVDKQRRIAWYGHPLEGMDRALQRMLDGKYDLEQIKKVNEARRMLKPYYKEIMRGGDAEKATKLGQRIFELGSSDARLMNELAHTILVVPDLAYRDLDLAMRSARAAYDASEGKDPEVLMTYALALFENGKTKQALQQQERAVELARSPREKYKAEQMLEDLRRRAEDKDADG